MSWTWPGERDEARHFHHSSAPSTPPPAPSTAPTSVYTQTPEQKKRKVKSANVGPASREVPEDTPEPLGGNYPTLGATASAKTRFGA